MSLLTKLAKAMSKTPATQTTPSASKAKERLSVILASQRNSDIMQQVNMEALQQDVLQVLQRHIEAVKGKNKNANVNGSMVSCNMRSEGDVCLLEMSVEIDGIQTYQNTGSNSGGRRN